MNYCPIILLTCFRARTSGRRRERCLKKLAKILAWQERRGEKGICPGATRMLRLGTMQTGYMVIRYMVKSAICLILLWSQLGSYTIHVLRYMVNCLRCPFLLDKNVDLISDQHCTMIDLSALIRRQQMRPCRSKLQTCGMCGYNVVTLGI